MKAYPLLPVIFIAAYIFVAISIALDYKENDDAALKGLVVVAGFIALYFLAKLIKKSTV